MQVGIPANESSRLAALGQYHLLDTSSEKSFDQLTSLASYICETPIALMVLLDENRQWFKSRVGLSATETPREHAFCAHAVQSGCTLVVEDASQDLRFADNPLVTAEPYIRFYAGSPLINKQGLALGTLCVIDRQARVLHAEQLNALEMLAQQVVAQMELRKVARELATALEGLQQLQAMLPMCAWCKCVRNDNGYWSKVEDYLSHYTGSKLTHGICPACFEKEISQVNS